MIFIREHFLAKKFKKILMKKEGSKNSAQKMFFFVTFFCRTWLCLLTKSLMENFIFCVVENTILAYFTQCMFLLLKKLFSNTAQKVKFSIKNFFSKCDQILRIWSHVLKNSLTENLIFCAAEN